MASITAQGIGSGLDVAGLVAELVAAERAPTQLRIDSREALAQTKLSSLGSIKSALAAFQAALEPLKSLSTFQGRLVSSNNPDVFTASATSEAIAGRYTVEVVELASTHKLRSAAFTTPTTMVGTGTLTITAGGTAFDIEITSPADTLDDIRNAINAETTNTQVAATIVNSVDGAHLVLTSATSGSAGAISVVASGGDGGLDALVFDPLGSGTTNLTEVSGATDGSVLIDGLAVTATSNVVADAIDGVTIDLLAADPGFQYQLDIAYDPEGATELITAFVDSYNSLVDTFAQQTSFDEETFASGPLFGESIVRNILSQLRTAVGDRTDGATGEYTTLAEIGITTSIEGKLEFDVSALGAALDEGLDNVGRLFSAESGFATTLDALVTTMLETDSGLETRTGTLESQIEDYADQRATLDRRMLAVEERLRAQFTALDSLIGELNSTSSFLGQQLAALPGFTFDGN